MTLGPCENYGGVESRHAMFHAPELKVGVCLGLSKSLGANQFDGVATVP